MLQTLAPSRNPTPTSPASSRSTCSRPVSKNISMTLGAERKVASSDLPPAAGSRFSGKKNAKTQKSDGSSAGTPLQQGKPKTILSCKCSELKMPRLTTVHQSVQLHLTSYNEILVLKKGDKSHDQTVLRRHSVENDTIKEHPILTNALLVDSTSSEQKYVYQLEKEKTLRQWLAKITASKQEVQNHASQIQGVKNSCDDSPPSSSVQGGLGNGFIVNQSAPISPPAAAASYHHHRTTASLDLTPEEHLFTRSLPPISTSTSTSSIGSVSAYSHGPCSPEPNQRSSLLASTNSAKSPFSLQTHTTAKTTASTKGVLREEKPFEDYVNQRRDKGQNQERVGDDCDGEVVSNSMLSTHHLLSIGSPAASPALNHRDHTLSLALPPSPTNSAYLSRNSSARSSNKSLGSGSDRALNLSVLQESLEASYAEDFVDGVKRNKETVAGVASSPRTRNRLSLNLSHLAEKRGSFVRRASDQLAGLLKMSSLRDSPSRNYGGKRKNYVRLCYSVSELDSMLASGAEVDDAFLPLPPPAAKASSPRTPRSVGHTPPLLPPLTPGSSPRMLSPNLRSENRNIHSPLSTSRNFCSPTPLRENVCSPNSESENITSPVSSGGDTNFLTSPLPLEEGERVEDSGDENCDTFAVSRFHHTQIRNRKRKQSPRIRGKMAGEGAELEDSGKYGRSVSESPTAGGKMLSQRGVDSRNGTPTRIGSGRGWVAGVATPTRRGSGRDWGAGLATPTRRRNGRGWGSEGQESIRAALRGYATPPSQSSTLPRSRKERRHRLTSETGHSTTSNSPVPGSSGGSSNVGGTKLTVAGKSPKLLRIFHRRQSSSSLRTMKVFAGDSIAAGINSSSMDSDLSSFSLDSTPGLRDHAPKKLHQFPAKEVATELTLMDSELLRSIRPEELKDAAWTKKDTKEVESPNVLLMVRSFNQLALLVPTEVLSETTPTARAKVISAFIQIAQRCYALHNYNSLKAVLAGLQCTPIYRLDKTWKEVSSKRRKRFEQLCELMSEEDNWQQYRSRLEKHMAQKTPFIPFLGMFLTQVVQKASYHKIRQQTSVPKVVCDDTHLAPPHTPLYSPPAVQEAPPMPRMRRRSSSLGEKSSPTITVTPSTLTSEDPSNQFNRFSYVVRERDDNVFMESSDGMVDFPTDNVDMARREGVVLSSAATPTPDQAHPTIAVEMCEDNDSEEIDSSNAESTHSEDLAKDGRAKEMNDDLELEDISFKLKRRSWSFESLFSSFAETRDFSHLLRDTPLTSSLQSLADSTDEDTLDQEDEEEEAEQGEELASTYRAGNSQESSDHDYHTDLDSSLSCSLPDNRVNGLMDPLPGDHGFPLPMSHSFDDRMLHTATEATVNESTSATSVLTFTTSDSNETCPLPSVDSSSSTDVCTLDPEQPEYGEGPEKIRHLRRKIVKRSKSQDSSSKNTLNPKPKANGVPQFLRKPKQATPTLSATPTDMLIQFQIASMGCVMGVESRAELRTVVKESETNSEKDNYVISQKRE